MKNKTIITIAGRTAAGKSIIAKKLAERLGLTVLKSYTTRAPRPDEIANPADADHIFVSEAEYDKLTDIIAETCINGNRYCTTKEVLKNSDCYVIDPDGLSYLKKNLEPGFRLAQFYVYADEDIRKKRFMERGKSESEFRVRSDAENEQFLTYEDEHGYDIIIFNNGNIEDAVDIMESYVKLIIKDRLDEIEAKKNGTWVEPEPDDEEAAPDEEASNQEKKACSDSAAEVKWLIQQMNCKMRKQKKTLHQMKVFLLQTASSTLTPKKAMKQQTRLQQSQKIRTLTRSALMKTIPQRLDLRTKPENLPQEL